MSTIKSSNIPQYSIGKVVDMLADMYIIANNKHIKFKDLPSVMLWGAPGLGKSQGIRQVAEKIQSKTGKRVNVTDVRLLLFNPIDLRGIPTSNADKTLAVWLKPQIFQMDSSENVINILFLDEISACPQSVQAAAYQITLDRVIGEHKLPDNCIVVAAGNRITDKSVAYKMPKALANRLCHFEIKESFESWKAWAVAKGINAMVLGYLSFKQDALFNFDTNNDDYAFATPRSWEMVSKVLNSFDSNVEKAYGLIAGIVGVGMAIEFKTWTKVYAELPNVQDIFLGKGVKVPTSPDALYALTSSMTAYAREHKDDLYQIANSITYAMRLPPDFSVMMLKDYMYLEDGYKQKLLQIPEFAKWLSTKGRFLNG